MLVKIYADDRIVYMFRHYSALQKARQRYLHTSAEIKAVNETMANLMSVIRGEETSEETKEEIDAAKLLLFPQPLHRVNSEPDIGPGAVNLRRVRFHWHYLLYAGNVETLKSEALCSFDYLEAVLRGCGLAHLLSIFEEVLMQIMDHGRSSLDYSPTTVRMHGLFRLAGHIRTSTGAVD